MRRSLSLLATAMFGGAVAFAAPVAAQEDGVAGPDFTTATYGGTTLWVGGGVQFLSLPDIKFVGKGNPGDFRRQKNSDSDWLDFGPAAGGGIETALGYWGNARVTAAVKGFWANVETDNRTACRNTNCVVVDPTGTELAFGPPTLRDQD